MKLGPWISCDNAWIRNLTPLRSDYRYGMDRYIHMQSGRVARIADEAARISGLPAPPPWRVVLADLGLSEIRADLGLNSL